MSSVWQSLWMLYCWLQLGLNPALFPFTGLCEGTGFEKPPPCRRQIRSCRYIFITKEQKHPPGTLATFCQTAEEVALCTSPKRPPAHGIISPKWRFPRPSQWVSGSVASTVFKSFILSGASILMIFSVSSPGNSSVDWLLLLTGVSGAYCHCCDLTKLAPDPARICWGKNWLFL